MSAVELEDVIPGRSSQVIPTHIDDTGTKKRAAPPPPADDDLDDGWGPPGTTIPPPLLGAVPGATTTRVAEASRSPNRLRAADRRAAAAAGARAASRRPSTEAGLSRALEEATSACSSSSTPRARDRSRPDHRADDRAPRRESHRRAGFFAMREPVAAVAVRDHAAHRRDAGARSCASIARRRCRTSSARACPIAGRCTTTRAALSCSAMLGTCPPEILLVPVAVRERVVGVLFGEHASCTRSMISSRSPRAPPAWRSSACSRQSEPRACRRRSS